MKYSQLNEIKSFWELKTSVISLTQTIMAWANSRQQFNSLLIPLLKNYFRKLTGTILVLISPLSFTKNFLSPQINSNHKLMLRKLIGNYADRTQHSWILSHSPQTSHRLNWFNRESACSTWLMLSKRVQIKKKNLFIEI